MKKNLKQALKITGFLALALVLLLIAFRNVAFRDVMPILLRANYWWVALSLFLLFLSFVARARRWMLLIEPLGHKPGFRNTYNSLMFGYLSNYALPRMGEVTRCVSLGRKENIPMDSLVGTVIVERTIDLLMTLAILAVLLLNWMNEKAGGFFEEQLRVIEGKLISSFGSSKTFLLIAMGVLLLFGLLAYLKREQLSRSRLFLKVRGLVTGVFNGLRTITQMKRWWEFILQSLLIYFFYIMMTWVMVFALPETAGLKLIDGIFLLAVGSLGMAAPVTGGIGAFHWITSAAMVHVYEQSPEIGAAYSILSHEPNALITILLGIISSYMLTLGRKRHKAEMTQTPDQ